jgi:hypothetical protein
VFALDRGASQSLLASTALPHPGFLKDEVQVLFGRKGCRAHNAILSAFRKSGISKSNGSKFPDVFFPQI